MKGAPVPLALADRVSELKLSGWILSGHILNNVNICILPTASTLQVNNFFPEQIGPLPEKKERDIVSVFL